MSHHAWRLNPGVNQTLQQFHHVNISNDSLAELECVRFTTDLSRFIADSRRNDLCRFSPISDSLAVTAAGDDLPETCVGRAAADGSLGCHPSGF